ncbi:hypothetical protein C8Q75DRAFT_810281 [Abortiporus biennis]|nr:hypothetical protein C8Q75DRAFT_810281 [Abortiporus biennis]
MFFKITHVATAIACLAAAANAAPPAAHSSVSGSADVNGTLTQRPPPPVSTFTATKVFNTLLTVEPFLTVATTTVVWTETISSNATSTDASSVAAATATESA